MPASVFRPPLASPSIEVELLATPCSVPLARRLVREWFRHWHLPTPVIDAAELVTSELVTNGSKAKAENIRLRFRRADSSGFIEVWDGDPNPPVRKTASTTDTGGRGLHIVSALATRWNFYPSAGGKVVWAELNPAEPKDFHGGKK